MKLLAAVVLGMLISGCGGSKNPLFLGSGSESANAGSLKTTQAVGNSTIAEIYAGSCKEISRGGFIWMTDSVLLEDLVAPLGDGAATAIVQKVSFDSQGALMVDFGEIPTPGFDVRLMNKQLQLDGSKAIVQVDLVKLSESADRLPQVLTHPCAIYVVPSLGYNILEVQSALGDVFTTFEN